MVVNSGHPPEADAEVIAATPAAAESIPEADKDAGSTRVVYRHRLPIRIMHWINVIALTLMFMSGLQIFNAHPSLYWGQRSDPGKQLLELGAQQNSDGQLIGITRIGGHDFTTTGFLGVS